MVERWWVVEGTAWEEEVVGGWRDGITSVLRRIAGAFVFHLVALKWETAMVDESTMRRSKKDDVANKG